MRYTNVLDISLYQLQLFIEVAEKENITKAANCNHVSQSMLSKSIKNMESTLGLQLFFHDKKSIHLTPAGKILKEQFKTTINQIEKAIEFSHACQEVQYQPIIIGFQDSFNPQKIITPMVKQYMEFNPNFKYHGEAFEFQEIAHKLVSKEIDIAFTSLFDTPSFLDNDLNYYIVETFPLQAFMLSSNPLSQFDSLTFDMLQQQSFVVIAASVSPTYLSTIIDPLSKKHGFVPKISHYASSAKSIASNLQNSDQIFIADQYNGEAELYGHIAKDILETQSGVIMGYRKNSNESIMNFVKFIKSINEANKN